MNSKTDSTSQAEGGYQSLYTLLGEVLAGRKPVDLILEHPEFQSRAKRICCSLEHNREDAEDLFQEICLRVWKYGRAINPDHMRNGSEFYSWLFVLSRNAFFSRKRKKGLLIDGTPVDDLQVADHQLDLETQCYLSELMEFSKTLPLERRLAFEYLLAGYSLREIKKKLKSRGIDVSHVRIGQWIHDALAAFRNGPQVPVKKAVGY